MAFTVGQKVVCVKLFIKHDIHRTNLVVNRVYTISDIKAFASGLGINLVEEPAEKQPCFRHELGYFPFYFAELFRPVVERKADISIFTKMLNPQKRTVDA